MSTAGNLLDPEEPDMGEPASRDRMVAGIIRASFAASAMFWLLFTSQALYYDAARPDAPDVIPSIALALFVSFTFGIFGMLITFPVALAIAMPALLFAHRRNVVSPLLCSTIGLLTGLAYILMIKIVNGVNPPFAMIAIVSVAGSVAGLVYWATTERESRQH
jgi:hypothetical protein